MVRLGGLGQRLLEAPLIAVEKPVESPALDRDIASVLSGEHAWKVVVGDALELLRTMPSESVHCVATSPPYWGLRDYGTGRWEGGDPSCKHARKNFRPDHSGETILGRGQQPSASASATPMRSVCTFCGAVRVDEQIGLEPTVAQYVERLVDVFMEVHRVLRSDGTCWINLGDTYSSSGRASFGSTIGTSSTLNGSQRSQVAFRKAEPGRRAADVEPEEGMPSHYESGFRPKNLLMLPARLAIALQDEGWYVRSDIIWAKPNPQPESVRDRPTKSKEYVYLLSKSESYAYDADAIREEHVDPRKTKHGSAAMRGQRAMKKTGSNVDDVGRWFHEGGRNARDVWVIPTKPYKEAHFATMPPELARRCVVAGCPDPNGIVLDPFAGAGTTVLVASCLGRRALGFELNPMYAELARKRVAEGTPTVLAKQRTMSSLLQAGGVVQMPLIIGEDS